MVGTQAIYLDPQDDIVSIKDRLDWVQEPRVILILPEDGTLLSIYLDLVLLRRRAEELRLELGLVTADSRVIEQAKVLGIPCFSSIEASLKNKRRWRRGRQQVLAGRRAELDEADKLEIYRRSNEKSGWRRWLGRYVAAAIYIFTLAILFVVATYTVPGATITLKPQMEPLQVKRQIVADPELEQPTASGASVPARVLTSVQEWQAEVVTTGFVEVPDSPAKGIAVFVNRISQPVEVPAGTRVTTTGGTRQVFQTLASVTVPGIAGGTAEAEIVAIEPGPDGNVASNLVNRIEGPLSAQLDVRNLEATSGGGSRLQQAVTEADHERLRSQVLQHLQVRALADMEAGLMDQEFLARDSLNLVRLFQETYSHFPGEATNSLTLEMRAEMQATAVDKAQAIALVYEELAAAVPPGFELVPESLHFDAGEVLAVDGQGRVTFEMGGEGQRAASLALEPLIARVAGQKPGIAVTYLNEQLPLRDYPVVRIWPEWFRRLPYLPVRIRTEIDTSAVGR